MRFMTNGNLNGAFVANYTLNTSIEYPTEIFFSQDYYYTKGYKLSVLCEGAPINDL